MGADLGVLDTESRIRTVMHTEHLVLMQIAKPVPTALLWGQSKRTLNS